ncbi:MAG: cyclic nucleotide-binding domain-containing protein [Bacteroidetes bacterium]|nr:cyclic nucleotide-binding domain-containing protein [Bacteroidota bacterium]
MTRHEYLENQIVIRKGEEGDALYIIANGTVRVHDEEQVVARMEAGNFFGEISFLDAAPRSMSVSADTKSVLYRILRNDFYTVFKGQPEITQIIVSTLTQRLRTQNENVISDLRSREAELSKLVELRTGELVVKNEQLSATLAELKSTQQQLIQQEKLASLGQLTAGIAHEIKNPLNFVNNFAKLSFDLVDEIVNAETREERDEIGKFLSTNLEKIHTHGSRADTIVKGMLEHTRTGGNTAKYPIDINKMCEQFAKITLQNAQATWPGFDPTIIYDFDSGLQRIPVIASEFTKMMVNLLNNAWYAVREKSKSEIENYTPTITITTNQSNNRLIITVKDNGPGIPVEIRGQIFNPFFTTKPTGEGAGLGLSITHDIVAAHGGTIVCESEENIGSIFLVSIPIDPA